MPFVTDEEIVFNANDLDLLNGRAYSSALTQAIENAPSKGTFIIGLFGEWGIGKSSIIKTTEANIVKKYKNKIKFITYDAWKYVDDNFRRTFIIDVNKQLGVSPKQIEVLKQKLYTDTVWETAKKVLNIRNVSIVLGIMILSVLLLHYIFGMSFNIAGAFSLFGGLSLSFMIFCMNTVLHCFSETKQSINTPLLFSPEQFEDEFQKALKYNEKQKRIKLVITIDNIDRCSAEVAYQLLTNIKTFMIEHDDLIFIIPTDNKSLCEHFAKRFKGDSGKAYEFLRKIFNLEIHIKPLDSTELFKFTNDINKKYKLGFSPNAISIIANEYASNPRRIKQFFNNAISEIDVLGDRLTDLSVADLELAKNTVCKLLIIRDEWPWYYELVLKDPNLLLKSDYTNIRDDLHDLAGLKTFLKCTAPFKCLRNEHLLRKIISNNSYFDVLKKSIKELDEKEITEFISKSADSMTLFIKYACGQMREKLKQKVYIEVVNIFRAIITANNVKELSDTHNSMIQSEIIGNIKYIIEEFPEVETSKLMVYINSLNKQGRTYLFNEIITNYIKPLLFAGEEVSALEKLKASNLLDVMISDIEERSLFKNYQDIFFKWYKMEDESITKINSPEYFISNDFIKHLIENMDILDNDDFYYNELLFVANLQGLDDELATLLLDKVNDVYMGYEWGKKTLSLSIVDKLASLIKLMKFSQISNSFKSLFDKLFREQRVYINYSYQNKSLKDELSSDAEFNQIIDFLSLMACIATQRKIKDEGKSLKDSLKDVYKQYIKIRPDLKGNMLTSLRISLEGKDCIITDLDYLVFGSGVFNEDHLYFVKQMSKWTFTKTGRYIIEDKTMADEIKSIIYGLQNRAGNHKETISSFVEDMLTLRKEAATQAILSEIEQFDKDVVVNLPDSAKKLVLNNIVDNLDNYESEHDMLEFIAEHGDKPMMAKLMTALLKKVVDETTRQEAIEIYGKIPPKNLAVRDKNKMKPWLEDKDLISK